MKRSSWASGRLYVPSDSIGFCVASTRNGRSSLWLVPLDRHAILLHDLQQRGVRLGRRAVDLVGQQQLREDRAGPKAKLLRLHVEDRRAGDVRGHQVGGELDAAELAAQHAAQRAHEERLAQARHALDQHVPAGEQRHQRAQHQLVLADVDLADLGGDAVEQLLESARRRGWSRRRAGGSARQRFAASIGMAAGCQWSVTSGQCHRADIGFVIGA